MSRLRRSDPARPGWTRHRSGRGFSYRDESGAVLTGADRERCQALAIPPAWTDVWICPWPNGHLQAVGTDDAGRRQYLYHPQYRAGRDRVKFDRMLVFGQALAGARSTVSTHLALPGMPEERALAVGFRMLDLAGLRVGGEAYARDHGTVGVATLRRAHASTSKGEVRLQFPGKSGRSHDLTIADAPLASAVRELLARRSGGPELLAYRRDGRWTDLTSSQLNSYVRQVMDLDVTAKDFRTWQGAVAALEGLAQDVGQPSRRALADAMRQVADHLGNTPAVARSAYVDPRIVERFLAGAALPTPAHAPAGDAQAEGLGDWEGALLSLLEGFGH